MNEVSQDGKLPAATLKWGLPSSTGVPVLRVYTWDRNFLSTFDSVPYLAACIKLEASRLSELDERWVCLMFLEY